MPRILVPKENRHLLTPIEVAQMIEKAITLKDKAIIALYYITGIRAKEAFFITKEDIWYDKTWLWIKIRREKRSKKETIPKIDTLKISMEAPFIKHITDFIDTINGGYVWYYADNHDTARVYVWKMIKKLNPDVWIHLFRHTRAESFRMKGFSDRQLMDWFGWSDVRTTSRYTHPGEDTIEEMGRMIE